MKLRRLLHQEWLQLLILALPFVLAAAWWDRCPAVVVTHWGLRGQPNGWMPKFAGLLAVPALNVVICLGLAFLPRIAPRWGSTATLSSARYRQVLRVYRYALTTFMAEIAAAVIAKAAGWEVAIDLIAINGALALLAVVGNFFGRLEPNYFVGCRTPWTLQDADTWRATHRTTGRLMVFGAVALLGAEFFVGRGAELGLFLVYLLGIGAWSMGYSAWFFRRHRPA